MMRLACASPLAPCALILFTFLGLAANPPAQGARGLAVSQFKSMPYAPCSGSTYLHRMKILIFLQDLQGLGDGAGYSAWLHDLSVASLEPDTVSNDGNATVHVELLGPECPLVRFGLDPVVALRLTPGPAPRPELVQTTLLPSVIPGAHAFAPSTCTVAVQRLYQHWTRVVPAASLQPYPVDALSQAASPRTRFH